jgi:NDP-sugar pyrophosphorylase family protein
VNGGVYVLEPAVIDAIPSDRVVSLEHDIFPAMLATGSALFGFPVHGFFVDIGTPEGYHQFCAYALGHRA